MRSKTNDTVSVCAAHAATLIETHLKIWDHGHKYRATILASILLFAAARMRLVCDACGRLRDVPSDRAVRNALVAMLPDMDTLERRINAELPAELPCWLTKRPQRLAVDLTLIPYHGQPFLDPNEIDRSQPKSGTTHFYAYASCYVVEHGQRLTLVMNWVGKGEPLKETLQRLLKQVRSLGIKIHFLLLDREFYSVNIIRYLQASCTPFLMPVAHRGRKLADPRKAKGTRRFLRDMKSGLSKHTLQNKEAHRVTLRI